MCGIAGCLGLQDGMPPPALEDLEAMVGALQHRGPDGFGLYRDRDVGLGHARLSIIDLASGQQPLANEDETIWIAFNGEIFNYLELRSELVDRGHRFRTRSDTEVVVHSFEEWGEGAFERFNGQFAIALWDAPRRTLVLARDRLGVRPLYLREHAGRLWFGSEVRSLFAGAPDGPRSFDPVGLVEAFTFWTPVAPQTVFEGISELAPGHVRVVTRERTTDHAFWTPAYGGPDEPRFSGTEADAAEAVRAALEDSVRLRMLRSDVPVGSYLSGGLDSSLVAALGRRAKEGAFLTFSVRFEDAEYDETAFQRAVAVRVGSEHREVVVTRQDIAAAFPAAIIHAERPILRTAPVPLFLLSRLVRETGIKVVLTGEGADEMFAGYDLFREGKVRRFWARQPTSTLRPRLLERLYPYLARSPVAQRALAREFFGRDLAGWRTAGFAHRPRWQSTSAVQRLLARDLLGAAAGTDVVGRLLASLPGAFPGWDPLAQDQYLEIRTLLSGYLLSSQGDRMLMGHSVEGRFPFLDLNVVALANSLPPRFKLKGLHEKHVLKMAAEGLVPGEVLRRPKQPFRAPDALSFVGKGAPAWVAEVLDAQAVAAAGVFDPIAVGRLWRKCQATGGTGQFSNADNMALVGVLSTGVLHEALIRRNPSRDRPLGPWTHIDRLADQDGRRRPSHPQPSRWTA